MVVPLLNGTIIHHEDFSSRFVPSRLVDVWLPDGIDRKSKKSLPVIYMQDGQMMFRYPESLFAGSDSFWDVDKAITRLVKSNEIRPPIVVAVASALDPSYVKWHKDARRAEFMPQKPVEENLKSRMESGEVRPTDTGGIEAEDYVISSDNYLRFLVEELKPFIDKTYPTLMGQADTFIMGSSMGGLISAYAVAEYPEVYGGAACLSTAWKAMDGAKSEWHNDVVVEWLSSHWPTAGRTRVYFDYGTKELDAKYEPGQKKMDDVLSKHGFVEGEDWVTRRFVGAGHRPKDWRERVHIPLRFLLGTD